MVMRACGTCIAWHPDSYPVRGECRAFPPRPARREGKAVWPTTDENDWCLGWIEVRSETPSEEPESAPSKTAVPVPALDTDIPF